MTENLIEVINQLFNLTESEILNSFQYYHYCPKKKSEKSKLLNNTILMQDSFFPFGKMEQRLKSFSRKYIWLNDL